MSEENSEITTSTPDSILSVEPAAEQVVETPTPLEFTMENLMKELGDDYKDNKSLGKFKSPAELAKSYTEMEKLVGKKSEIPDVDAEPEVWAEFYGKLGKPEQASEYGVELPEMLKGLEGSEDKMKAVMDMAHEANLSTSQAQQLFKGLFEMETNEILSIQQSQADVLKAGETELREEWGNSFDNMIGEVKALEQRLGVFEAFEDGGLNTNPALLKALGKLAGDLKETSTIDNAIASTPQGVESEMDEVMSQIRGFMKTGETIPKKLNDRRTELFQKMV